MIDDRNSVQVRHVNVNNRFSESVPDYEDVKVSFKLNYTIRFKCLLMYCFVGRLRRRFKYFYSRE